MWAFFSDVLILEDLSNRHAQCEIELNIAYAYAQLSDFSNAATHYDCSYQAAVDTGTIYFSIFS